MLRNPIGFRRWVVHVEQPIIQLTGESLGIDVGVKDLAICSNGMTFKNINKTKEVRRLKNL